MFWNKDKKKAGEGRAGAERVVSSPLSSGAVGQPKEVRGVSGFVFKDPEPEHTSDSKVAGSETSPSNGSEEGVTITLAPWQVVETPEAVTAPKGGSELTVVDTEPVIRLSKELQDSPSVESESQAIASASTFSDTQVPRSERRIETLTTQEKAPPVITNSGSRLQKHSSSRAGFTIDKPRTDAQRPVDRTSSDSTTRPRFEFGAVQKAIPSANKKPAVKGRDYSNYRIVSERGSSVTANLCFSDPVRLEGAVSGSIDSTDVVVIGARASVEARVKGRVVVVLGAVKGPITATHSIVLHAGATVKGAITAPRLTVEEGAVLNGKAKMATRKPRVVL